MAIDPTIDLSDRVALVTGASRGIGRAIAEAYVAAGASVMLSSRKQDALDEVAAAIGEPPRVGTVAANSGDPEAAVASVAATVDRFGGLDILVNNAGTNPYAGPTIEVDVGRYDKTYEVNLRGPLLIAQAAWRAVMAERGGNIINVASIGGFKHESPIGIYNHLKAGLIHLTRVMASEMGPKVRVNALAPGLVRTDFARMLWEGPAGAVVEAGLPLQRLGEPDDIAGPALFLASDLAGWMTGHTLVVDGGALVSSRG